MGGNCGWVGETEQDRVRCARDVGFITMIFWTDGGWDERWIGNDR
jgi:hypothetical protein